MQESFDIYKEIFEQILEEPENVERIPYDVYNKLFKFLLKEERFEDLVVLKDLENKMVLMTLKEILEKNIPIFEIKTDKNVN